MKLPWWNSSQLLVKNTGGPRFDSQVGYFPIVFFIVCDGEHDVVFKNVVFIPNPLETH